MFSSFGVSAITGSLLVALLQYEIGYTGVKYLCLSLTLVAFFLILSITLIENHQKTS